MEAACGAGCSWLGQRIGSSTSSAGHHSVDHSTPPACALSGPDSAMESISRISSLLETARDLTLEAANNASNVRRTSAKELPSGQLKKLLDSRAEREVLEGLRRVVTMSYRQPPSQTLPFFSHVIKNVASPSLQVKKLVYIYLLQHAEHEPDTALLSINTIQKSLSDANPQLRALALRVMSSIRVPVISQIVSLGIKRGAGDMSPLVRRAAALAIPKCYRLDPNTEPQLLEYLSILLGDKQYFVSGAAVAAFLELCPDRLDLLHPHYRSLVRKLVDMDEWGQLATLRLMMVYVRKCFPRRTRKVQRASNGTSTLPNPTTVTKGFYDSESDSEEEEKEQDTEEIAVLDPDLELLLKACQPLLQSRNAAVVVAVARAYLYLGTSEYVIQAIGPLVSLLRSAGDIQNVALYNIVQVCLTHPEPFVQYYTHFLVRSTDAPQTWRLKLELLTLIFPYAQPRLQSLILAELSHFSHSGSLDPTLVKESVRAIGRCSQSPATTPQTSARCLRLLLKHIGSADGHLVSESLEVIRHLIQRDPDAHRTTVVRLAKHLDAATSPQARASIIWLVGEFSGLDPENNIAADVLRILVKGFADEAEPAKLQIVLLAAKVYIHHLSANPPLEPVKVQQPKDNPSLLDNYQEEDGGFRDANFEEPAQSQDTQQQQKAHPIKAIYDHLLLLTRYDTSYDLRDRARVYKALLATPTSTQLASLLLLAPKPVPHIPSPSETRKGYVLGSASLVIGDEGGVGGLRGYDDLPRWVKDGNEPDPALRDESLSATASSYDSARTMSAADRLDAAAGPTSSRTPDSMISPRALNGGDTSLGAGVIKGKEKTLDDWLAEESGSEETTDEEEGESDEEEESEYETESESGDEGDRLVK
ncbi:adaptin N terminal region-domain-containing protein [Ampelomyces quisqualis]|uniref:Adaptin N terminal region-domain-containing protein n=1 Tax=Ampelomyces quisqualis TaxID=50730 RepID=A0A6A5R106_AMPQU|nr:adaptin N terminal region-domain-containing protein [Ampelomyces quisqualis]